MTTKVLIVGSGAREHALAWRLSRDGDVKIAAAPGNAGMALFARCFEISATDQPALVELARQEEIDLVVVGPEAPLVAGLADRLGKANIPAFGPTAAAAKLEGSKIHSKQFMQRYGIPTANFEVFDDPDAACAYVTQANRPLVVKADGLAAGKGVVVARSTAEAVSAIDHMMNQRAFGEAGARVLIEECLVGEEVSFHVIANGERYVSLAPAQDHKAVLDGDRGPNTGGMGAYSPPPVITPSIEDMICKRVVEPTLRGLCAEGTPYRGVLFVGLMIVDGCPQVLEYNVRFGDPEAEVLMARLGGSVTSLLMGAATGELSSQPPRWEAPASLCVVLASEGYPGSYPKGRAIRGLDRAAKVEGVTVFHAGTQLDGSAYVTAGGRVLTVTATGSDIDQAAARAYRAADLIDFEGKHCRRDIGWRARSQGRSL